MKNYRCVLLIVIGFLSISSKSYCQKKVDKMIDGIKNEKLEFEIAKIGVTKIIDSGTVTLPQNQIFVKSIDLQSLTKKEREKFITRLLLLLDDNEKDWYSNVLLYALTGRDASPLITIQNREEWITFYKEKDLEYWRKYLAKEQ